VVPGHKIRMIACTQKPLSNDALEGWRLQEFKSDPTSNILAKKNYRHNLCELEFYISNVVKHICILNTILVYKQFDKGAYMSESI